MANDGTVDEKRQRAQKCPGERMHREAESARGCLCGLLHLTPCYGLADLDDAEDRAEETYGEAEKQRARACGKPTLPLLRSAGEYEAGCGEPQPHRDEMHIDAAVEIEL